MTFDLQFVSALSRSQAVQRIEAFLSREPHVTRRGKPGHREWLYRHPDTLATFLLNVEPPDEQSPDGPDVLLSAGLNYFRPRFFAWEFGGVIERLARAARLRMIDVQSASDRPAEATRSRIIRSWIGTNRDILRRRSLAGVARFMSADRLRRWWLYQRDRQRLIKRMGLRVFVPELFIVQLAADRHPCTAWVWSDSIPSLFPVADYVMLYRYERRTKGHRGSESMHAVRSRRVIGALRGLLSRCPLPSGTGFVLNSAAAIRARPLFDQLGGRLLAAGSCDTLSPEDVTDLRP